MGDIVFARTRYSYDPYTDFWKLVELSNFPICYVDEIDISSANTYITTPMNGEFRPHVDHRKTLTDKKCELIMWNLERPGGSGGLGEYVSSAHELIDNGYLDAIIVSDPVLAKIVGAKFVPLGSHKDFGVVTAQSVKCFDLIHLSCYSPRRSWLFRTPSEIQYNLFGLRIAPNAWGDNRNNLLCQTRIMLCIHQDEFPYIEPLRYAIAAAYGMPILTEHIEMCDTFPYVVGMNIITGGMLNENTSSLVGVFGQQMVHDYDNWYEWGLKFRELMTCEYSFRNCVEKFL